MQNIVGSMAGTSMDAFGAALIVVQGAALEIRAQDQRRVPHALGRLVGSLR